MGLLDEFAQFIKTPEGQGVASAIAGGLAGARRGEPLNSLGRAGMAGLLGYSNAQERNTMEEYKDLQMKTMKAQQAAAQRKESLLQNLLGGGQGSTATTVTTEVGSSTPFRADYGLTAPSVMPAAAPATSGQGPDYKTSGSGGFLANLTPDKLAALKLGADVDLTDVYKLTQPNWQNVNGNLVNTNAPGFQGGFQPGIQISQDSKATLMTIGPDGVPRIQAAPGSLETFGAFEDRRNASAAQNRPIKVWNTATQREEYVSEHDVVNGGRGVPTGPSTPVPTSGGSQPRIGGGQNLTPALADLIRRDAEANGITNPMTNFTGAGRGQGYGVQPQTPLMSPQPTPQGQGFAAGPSTTEKASSEAYGEVNKSWLKNSFEPVIATGNAASETLGNIQAARQTLGRIGETGWGTETKAYAANVLTGLGVSSQNAKMYATNVQQFQNIAMTNLKSALDAAKGPQTEGDADRGSKLFAQLQNTPQANEFILDLAEAKAQRDAMKARFFQEALPVARSKGDLQEVEREWSRRAPSIFSLPSMKKWGAK